MPAARINMRKLKDALRLKFEGRHSHQYIAAALGISKGVVTKYVGLAVAAGLDWAQLAAMDEATLERRLLPAPRPGDMYAVPDWGRIHQELRRKGMTLSLLWEEYCAEVGERHCAEHPVKPWRYSQFCENYRRFAKSLKRSMRQSHRAGEKLFIDFAGPTVTLTDGGQANIFVAAMGASGYCFALATKGQTAADWLDATAQALSFYGGVPELIVPDNPRALVRQANRYEPQLSESALDFARHYGCSMLPARAYHPQDKAKVEMSVQLVERWILARLRNRRFFTLHELNQAIGLLLVDLNQRPFKKLPGCRRSAFEQLDAPALRALPAERFVISRWKTVKVNIDYHVEFDKHYYSAPYKLMRKKVYIRATQSTVEIFFNNKRVASHRRVKAPGRYTTVAEHMPLAHQKYLEWSPERFVSWAQKTGPHTAQLVQVLLDSRQHPQQAYRSCLGVLRLGSRYGEERLEACPGRIIPSVTLHGDTMVSHATAGSNHGASRPIQGES